ncbi:nucleotide exchange factor GrpE [Candidatus Gracilibacteria bacterium]|nr:nucleotide exchange factor GrpE [Candidatus Gracilibacteria bacterium]
MSENHDKEEILEEELMQEAEEVVADLEESEEAQLDEEITVSGDDELTKLKDLLARNQADYENFKKRTQRDKEDMIFFLKGDIFKKILPRLDDLERIIKNTPEDQKTQALFEGVVALEKTLKKDINSFGIQKFESKGCTINPERHDVMTQVPGEEGIIIDEFESGYMLGDRVLRVAKVVAGNGL